MKIAPSNNREQRQCRTSRKNSSTLLKRFHLECTFVLAFGLLHYFSCVHTLSLQSDFVNNEIQNRKPFLIDDGVETIIEEDDKPMIVSSQSNNILPTVGESSIDKKDAYNPMTGNNYVEKSPENFDEEQIKRFLSYFYLIKTKHGYILGRNQNQAKRNSLYSMKWPITNLISYKNMPSYKGYNLARYPIPGDGVTSRSNRNQLKWWWW